MVWDKYLLLSVALKPVQIIGTSTDFWRELLKSKYKTCSMGYVFQVLVIPVQDNAHAYMYPWQQRDTNYYGDIALSGAFLQDGNMLR